MTKNVLLTGAFGNIGKSTLDKLLAAGHKVVCLDIETPQTRKTAAAYEGQNINTVWGDINDRAVLDRALTGIDTVIHLAGIIPPLSEKNKELAQRVNVDGTNSVIAAMEASSDVKRLIFASTFGVFGKIQNRDELLTNDTEIIPDDNYENYDNYSLTKVAAERALRASSLDWTILRICASPPVEISKAHDIKTLFEMSANARIEFVHPDDVSTAFCNAVECDDAIGKALFLGGGEGCQMTGLKFVENMLDAVGISGGIPAEALKPSDPETGSGIFYGDYVDTKESQALLRFQYNTVASFKEDKREALGWKYHLYRLISPLAKHGILRQSPYLPKKKSKGSGRKL